jgi:Lon protease-like protein
MPVFPLPDYVLFPAVTARLHIFEERYRAMIGHALDQKGVFCMGTLRGSWEEEYHSKKPEMYSIGCACQIVDYNRLSDGRYDIQIEGLRKVSMIEIPSEQDYRQVRVRVLETDIQPTMSTDERSRIRKLAGEFLVERSGGRHELVECVKEMRIENLINMLGFHSAAPVSEKLSLLSMGTYAQMCATILGLYDAEG